MSNTPDRAALTALLQRHVGPTARCGTMSRAPSGNSQETWFIEVDGVDEPAALVLRRSAEGGTLEWSDRRAEVGVLRAVRAAGLPVPKVWWWEPDGGTLERGYLVMDRASGSNPDLRSPAVRSTLASELGRLIAELHQRVSPPGELDMPTRSTDSTRSQIEFWTDRARASPVTPAIVAAVCGWLAANLPDDESEPVLLWGDPGAHNVLTNESGEITALLDWELAHVGHRLFDLGAARWSCLGHLDRERLTDAYELATTSRVDRTTLEWFEVLACVSRSVMLFDGVQAVLDGRSDDPNLLGLGLSLVSANMLRAAQLAWGTEPATSTAGVAVAETPGLRPTPAERDLALARYLSSSVLPSVSDARIRRGLKIAAALLSMPRSDSTGADHDDVWEAFEIERNGTFANGARQRLVDDLAAARQSQQPLMDLYGDTVAIRFDPDHPPSSTVA